MRDEKNRFSGENVWERREEVFFFLRINRGRWFIEDIDACFAIERPRDPDDLILSARQLDRLILRHRILLPGMRVEPFWKIRHHLL